MSSTPGIPNPERGEADDKYSALSRSELLSRVTDLEAKLHATQSRLSSLLLSNQNRNSAPAPAPDPSPSSPPSPPPAKRNKPPKAFDPSTSSTRFIALKFAYLGSDYNGFEHANNNITPKPTVEEVLYKALRKTRLINPQLGEGCDDSVEVVWGDQERYQRYSVVTAARKKTASETERGTQTERNSKNGDESTTTPKVRLDLNWDGCEYSKCGRTDRGVSAFGQVIALRVRSNRPVAANGDLQPQPQPPQHVNRHVNGQLLDPSENGENGDRELSRQSIQEDSQDLSNLSMCSSAESLQPAWDPIGSELPYISLLNSVLPPSIRILAWLPHPPADFSARFSCHERHYRYFFTNPAFCPTPGPMGMFLAPSGGKGKKGATVPVPATVREGWLDIERMRQAARKLVGSHDYRNLCKIDPSKEMSSCVRSISYADIEEWPSSTVSSSNPNTFWTQNEHLNMRGSPEDQLQQQQQQQQAVTNDPPPKVYAFTVHGSAFLWHQVRCMMGILFLVGQGLEEPGLIDELLDIDKNARRPMYEMAEDKGLVLWNCTFGDQIDRQGWVYAGDDIGVSALTSKADGKFGMGGVANVVWKQWRAAKMDEILASSLLGLVLSQGDGSALLRGGFRDPATATASRSQKIFDGGDSARIQGRYVRVMDKAKMPTLEEQNDKYVRSGKGRRATGLTNLANLAKLEAQAAE